MKLYFPRKRKYCLGVTILLSLTVFLNMVSETMPVTSDNPLLGSWFGFAVSPSFDGGLREC